jgi:hypothetical protein
LQKREDLDAVAEMMAQKNLFSEVMVEKKIMYSP